MTKILIASLVMFFFGCASKKDEVTVSLDEAPKMDRTLNTGTGNKQETVGVRGDTVKVQKIVYLEQELSKTQGDIEDMENQIYGESVTNPGGMYEKLKDCRGRVADPRIGGNGIPEAMEHWEKISKKDDDFNYHVDRDNNVVGVSEEDLSSRITNLKKLHSILRDKQGSFKTKLDDCESKYKMALVNHGLDPQDTEARGEWVNGTWKLRRPASTDPEELMRRKQERVGN